MAREESRNGYCRMASLKYVWGIKNIRFPHLFLLKFLPLRRFFRGLATEIRFSEILYEGREGISSHCRFYCRVRCPFDGIGRTYVSGGTQYHAHQ